MSDIKKISFPYSLKKSNQTAKPDQPWAVFFGADFYNLPLDSNRELFIKRTNQIFAYMQKHLPNYRFIYLPHPNETNEYTLLNLTGFEVGERTLSEIFLYDNAEMIDYTFSAQSGASISAFAMGFDSVVFLDLLHGALSEETLTGYESYFSDLPDYFFIKSFETPLPRRNFFPDKAEAMGLAEISHVITPDQTIWVLAGEPGAGLRGAIIVKQLKIKWPKLKANLLIINHRRWQLGLTSRTIREAFDDIVQLPGQRIWYGWRPRTIWRSLKIAHWLKGLPIKSGDNFISFSPTLFEENCLLSYHPEVNKILLIENRWYEFIYAGGSLKLPVTGFHTFLGVRLFNYLLEPFLGLKRTIYKEYDDGKVLNILRYKEPLEKIYDHILVLMPYLNKDENKSD